MSDYLICPAGHHFLIQYRHDTHDRTILLGRCNQCHHEAATTIPKQATPR